MEIIFFSLSIILLIIALFWKKRGYEYFAIAGNAVFTASLVASIFDVSKRALVGDLAALCDIYPTMKWAYLLAAVVVILLSVIIVIIKNVTKK